MTRIYRWQSDDDEAVTTGFFASTGTFDAADNEDEGPLGGVAVVAFAAKARSRNFLLLLSTWGGRGGWGSDGAGMVR